MEALEAHLQRQIEHSRNFFWHRLRWDMVRQYLPADRQFELIDVGAGAGLLGEYLTRDFPLARYRFVEPLESLEKHLEVRFGADANARGDPVFGDAAFVCLLDVLEHQENGVEFLSQLAGKMGPRATLLVTVPALMSLWSAWDVALGHYRRYRRGSLRGCGMEAGLTVKEISYVFPEMVPAGLLRRLRHPPNAAGASGDSEVAEFPDLPTSLNYLLYATGRISLRLRRFSPFGTSVFAAFVRA